MCGFVALYQKNRTPIQEEILYQKTEVIYHRGPDEGGLHIDGPVGLGFRRLSIIDLANGQQPIANETDDIFLVFNGEIYNYLEQRAWLKRKGHTFKSHSDSEVLVHLYEELGTDCVKRLRGMFSFVIYDKQKNRLFGARDPFGIKPLYWTETSEAFQFGSEIKSLILDSKEKQVDVTSLYHYLTFQYVPDPRTMFKNVHKLSPGHYFVLENNNLTITRYFQVHFQKGHESFKYYAEQTREALEESVKLHSVCDVPSGAFLSGGIDSSSIVALLRKFKEELKTFSVGFDMSGYSELNEARQTARALKTDHYEEVISLNQYKEVLPKLIWHMDEPIADPSAIALYFVANLARQQVKVVLSGEGADEFFGGYRIYREPQALRLFSGMPPFMRKAIGAFAEQLPEGMKGKGFLTRGAKSLQERFFGNACIFSEEGKGQLLSDEYALLYDRPWEITEPIYEQAEGHDDVVKMQMVDIHTWLPGNILMKADKMTMANSLELRVPFVDPVVFQCASQIPTHHKIAQGTTKFILREAMKDILPSEVFNRQKLGFPVPIRHWLRHDLYHWAKEIIYDAQVEPWINKAYVLELLEIHKQGKADESRRLWTLLVFMQWHQIFMETPVARVKVT